MLTPEDSALPPINIQSGFFLFEAPKTEDEVEDYVARLRVYRKKSLQNPIIAPYNLTLTEQRPNVEYHTTNSALGKRAIPDLFTNPAFATLDALQLVLTRPLEVGEAKWSQVWQGTLTSTLVPSISPAHVVVKIYQESLFQYGPRMMDILGYSDDWSAGAYTAALEAYAFDHMRHMQGGAVPWSYGFYKVLLPHGESAFCHVMELIDGIPANSPRATVEALDLSDADIWNLADAFALALHQVHSCGFSHGDVDGRNVLLVNTARGEDRRDIGVVLIDFGLIVALEHLECPLAIILAESSSHLAVLGDMGVPLDVRLSWIAARRDNPPVWWHMFDSWETRLRQGW